MPEENHRSLDSDAIIRSAADLHLDAKKDLITQTMETLPPEETRAIAREVLRDATDEDIDRTKAVDAEPLLSLSSEEAREDLATTLAPTQAISDRLKQVIVWAFALVFMVSVFAALIGALVDSPQTDILFGWVTTLGGTLAGFIGGRLAGDSSNS